MTLQLDFGNIGPVEQAAVNKALMAGLVSTATPQVGEFEKRFAEYLDMPDAVATNSGSAALHLGLITCGIGPGDEVILPVLTFVATANVVRYVGATPIFVDVDMGTWTMIPELVEEAVTSRTKAIMPVHLYGVPCDMGHLYDIANTHNLYVIEDAAESLGATHLDRQTGTIGDVGCFSFNGNKTMTTSGGGLFVSHDPRKVWRARCLSIQGRTPEGSQSEVGYNYRMTGMAASLGLAQFDRFQEFLDIKRNIHQWYIEALGDHVVFQKAEIHSDPSWWYTAGCFSDEAESIQNKLSGLAIPTRRVFEPIPYMLPFRNHNRYPNGDYIYKHGLCLPCSTLNTRDDVDRVCKAIAQFS